MTRPTSSAVDSITRRYVWLSRIRDVSLSDCQFVLTRVKQMLNKQYARHWLCCTSILRGEALCHGHQVQPRINGGE